MKSLNLQQAIGKALVAIALSALLATQASAQDPNVHSGNAALILNNARANCTGLSLVANTTYILSYWVKGIDVGTQIGVTFATTVQGSGTFNDASSAVTYGGYQSQTSVDDQWHQYFAKITPSTTTNIFAFGLDIRPSPSYIDDVVLRQAGVITNLIEDAGFETAYQTNFDGDGVDWTTANWVDLRWCSEYAWDTHQYGNPDGPKALQIEGSPTNAPYDSPPDESWPAPTVISAIRNVLVPNQVILTYFFTGVQTASATNPANYAINNGNSVTGASLDSTFSVVTLTLANNLDNSVTNILTVNGVLGVDGSPIAANTMATISVPVNDLTRVQDSSADHLLVLEAEDYNLNLSPSPQGYSWVFTISPFNLSPTDLNTTYSGTGAMQASPQSGAVNNGANVLGPELDYKVYFPTVGTNYLWVRGVGDAPPGPNVSRSIQTGLDGTLTMLISGFAQGQGYEWLNTSIGGVTGPFVITTPGYHVINVWMRQNGFCVDKLLFSSNPNFNPTGIGPAESPILVLGPTITVARSGVNLVLSWTGGGVLQSSGNVSGTYADIPGSSSPWTVGPTNGQTYYRVKQ